MLAPLTLLFALYLGAALLGSKRPGDGERRAAMCSFGVLAPALISQGLPFGVIALLAVYFAAYLRRAR
jgi:hypothetical protein